MCFLWFLLLFVFMCFYLFLFVFICFYVFFVFVVCTGIFTPVVLVKLDACPLLCKLYNPTLQSDFAILICNPTLQSYFAIRLCNPILQSDFAIRPSNIKFPRDQLNSNLVGDPDYGLRKLFPKIPTQNSN